MLVNRNMFENRCRLCLNLTNNTECICSMKLKTETSNSTLAELVLNIFSIKIDASDSYKVVCEQCIGLLQYIMFWKQKFQKNQAILEDLDNRTQCENQSIMSERLNCIDFENYALRNFDSLPRHDNLLEKSVNNLKNVSQQAKESQIANYADIGMQTLISFDNEEMKSSSHVEQSSSFDLEGINELSDIKIGASFDNSQDIVIEKEELDVEIKEPIHLKKSGSFDYFPYTNSTKKEFGEDERNSGPSHITDIKGNVGFDHFLHIKSEKKELDQEEEMCESSQITTQLPSAIFLLACDLKTEEDSHIKYQQNEETEMKLQEESKDSIFPSVKLEDTKLFELNTKIKEDTKEVFCPYCARCFGSEIELDTHLKEFRKTKERTRKSLRKKRPAGHFVSTVYINPGQRTSTKIQHRVKESARPNKNNTCYEKNYKKEYGSKYLDSSCMDVKNRLNKGNISYCSPDDKGDTNHNTLKYNLTEYVLNNIVEHLTND